MDYGSYAHLQIILCTLVMYTWELWYGMSSTKYALTQLLTRMWSHGVHVHMANLIRYGMYCTWYSDCCAVAWRATCCITVHNNHCGVLFGVASIVGEISSWNYKSRVELSWVTKHSSAFKYQYLYIGTSAVYVQLRTIPYSINIIWRYLQAQWKCASHITLVCQANWIKLYTHTYHNADERLSIKSQALDGWLSMLWSICKEQRTDMQLHNN